MNLQIWSFCMRLTFAFYIIYNISCFVVWVWKHDSKDTWQTKWAQGPLNNLLHLDSSKIFLLLISRASGSWDFYNLENFIYYCVSVCVGGEHACILQCVFGGQLLEPVLSSPPLCVFWDQTQLTRLEWQAPLVTKPLTSLTFTFYSEILL